MFIPTKLILQLSLSLSSLFFIKKIFKHVQQLKESTTLEASIYTSGYSVFNICHMFFSYIRSNLHARLFIFWDRLLPCSPDSLLILNSSASASTVLGLSQLTLKNVYACSWTRMHMYVRACRSYTWVWFLKSHLVYLTKVLSLGPKAL